MTQRRTKRWWREQYVASHYAALTSPVILAELMKHKGFNTVTLARAVGPELARRGRDGKVSPQMIGQLRNGRLKSCSVDLGESIEAVMDVPAGFVFSVREKSSDKRENIKGAAA